MTCLTVLKVGGMNEEDFFMTECKKVADSDQNCFYIKKRFPKTKEITTKQRIHMEFFSYNLTQKFVICEIY